MLAPAGADSGVLKALLSWPSQWRLLASPSLSSTTPQFCALGLPTVPSVPHRSLARIVPPLAPLPSHTSPLAVCIERLRGTSPHFTGVWGACLREVFALKLQLLETQAILPTPVQQDQVEFHTGM